MRLLVIHANPDPDSFGASVLEAALAGLERAGHHADVIDLAAIDYEPCLSAAELSDYMTLATAHPDPVVADHIDRLRRAEGLVFVYPTWWGSMPAVMKGWVDRTLIPGVAFEIERGRPRGRLTQIRHLIGITTYGSPRLYRWFVGDGGRRTVRRVVRSSCGIRCRSRWLSLDALDTRPEADRVAFLEQIEREMASL